MVIGPTVSNLRDIPIRPQKLLFDASVLRPDGKGAARYVHCLLREYARLRPPDLEIVVLAHPVGKECIADWDNESIWDEFLWIEVPFTSEHRWRLLELPLRARALSASLIHVPVEAPVGPLSSPFVLTVHENPDVRHRLVEWSELSVKERISYSITGYLTPWTARRADRVLAVSQAVADEVSAEWDLEPTRVSVAYEAADEHFFDGSGQIPALRDVRDGYLLMFSTGDPREDIETVFAAYAAAKPAQALVVAGHHPNYSLLYSAAQRHGIFEDCHFIGRVPEGDLPALYASATIYLEMTSYEGFGLQVLEAMAAGTNVIASNLPVLREVAADGAMYVIPSDAEALCNSINMILLDAKLRASLSKRAIARAQSFSWRRCAEQTLAVYRQVLDI